MSIRKIDMPAFEMICDRCNDIEVFECTDEQEDTAWGHAVQAGWKRIPGSEQEFCPICCDDMGFHKTRKTKG